MKFPKSVVLLITCVLIALSTTLSAKKQELPDATEDGLHRVPDSRMAIVYAEPGCRPAHSQGLGQHPARGAERG